jgi:acid stress chaperone HdeB
MKALFAASLLAGTLLGVGASSADVIDLSTWKCSQFINADKDTVGIVLAWLDGYYQDEDAPPIIDKERFVGNAKKIGEYCAKNPDVGLITATDKLFGSD